MLRPILFVQVAFALLATVHAAPLANRAQLQTAAQVQTTQTTQTVQGLMTQTCTITLTPIKDANGNDAVEEVQTCTVAMSNGTGGGGQSGNSAAPPTNNGDSTSTGGSNAAGVVDGTTLVPASATGALASVSTGASGTSTSSSGTTSSTGAPGSNAAGSANGVSSVNAVPTVSGGAANPAGTAAAASAAPAAAFTLPGKKLSVLPIGLGVFAGISVIALIVVGLVTYERTKYRKAFRQRKLAEAGSAMGYGGMAQRT